MVSSRVGGGNDDGVWRWCVEVSVEIQVACGSTWDVEVCGGVCVRVGYVVMWRMVVCGRVDGGNDDGVWWRWVSWRRYARRVCRFVVVDLCGCV